MLSTTRPLIARSPTSNQTSIYIGKGHEQTSSGAFATCREASDTGGPTSPSAEGTQHLILERFGEVGKHGAVVGFHEGLDGHPRYEFDFLEARGLRGIDVDPNCIIALARSLILRNIGRDAPDHAIDLRRGALVQA